MRSLPTAALQTQGAKSHGPSSDREDGQSMLQKGHKREVYGEDHVDDGGLLEGHKKDREVQTVQELLEKVPESHGKPCGLP